MAHGDGNRLVVAVLIAKREIKRLQYTRCVGGEARIYGLVDVGEVFAQENSGNGIGDVGCAATKTKRDRRVVLHGERLRFSRMNEGERERKTRCEKANRSILRRLRTFS